MYEYKPNRECPLQFLSLRKWNLHIITSLSLIFYYDLAIPSPKKWDNSCFLIIYKQKDTNKTLFLSEIILKIKTIVLIFHVFILFMNVFVSSIFCLQNDKVFFEFLNWTKSFIKDLKTKIFSFNVVNWNLIKSIMRKTFAAVNFVTSCFEKFIQMYISRNIIFGITFISEHLFWKHSFQDFFY